MKILLDTILMNKSKRFLLPVLKYYGEEFVNKVSNIFKVAIGIGDMVLINSGIHYEKHIFILVNTQKCWSYWKDFINWIKEQPMYEDDYAYDSLVNGNLHMIVIKFPEQAYGAIEHFKHSQFSKMFNLQDIEKYFKDNPSTKGILIKDHNYRIIHTNKINNLYGTNIKPEELEGELEFPIEKEQEIFNLKLKQHV